MCDKKETVIKILVYGLTEKQVDGTCTFILNMQKYMTGRVIFDHVIEGQSSIYEKTIKNRKGIVHYISPKRRIIRNTIDWIKLLKKNRREYSRVYFNLYNLTWIVPIVLCRILGYKVTIHAHNNMLHNVGKVQKMLHMFNRKIQKFFKIQRLSNSDLSGSFFYDSAEYTIVKCAIETEKFTFNPDSRKKIRTKLHLQNNNIYGFVGRIAYQKNPLFLMRIFDEIQKIDNSAAFMICGDGNMFEETKKSAKDFGLNIYFLGDKDNISDYYSAMDAFVLPSLYEGLGIVLIEAQASGLPCVTSKNVVPLDAKVTDLLEYVSLEDDPKVWANIILTMREYGKYSCRGEYSKIVKLGDYDIVAEAKKLENLLSS